MQVIRSSNPPVVTGICDPNKSRARHHRNTLQLSVNDYIYNIKYHISTKMYHVVYLSEERFVTFLAVTWRDGGKKK